MSTTEQPGTGAASWRRRATIPFSCSLDSKALTETSNEAWRIQMRRVPSMGAGWRRRRRRRKGRGRRRRPSNAAISPEMDPRNVCVCCVCVYTHTHKTHTHIHTRTHTHTHTHIHTYIAECTRSEERTLVKNKSTSALTTRALCAHGTPSHRTSSSRMKTRKVR